MTKHPICDECYFSDGRAPAICEGCDDGEEFEPLLESEGRRCRNFKIAVRALDKTAEAQELMAA